LIKYSNDCMCHVVFNSKKFCFV